MLLPNFRARPADIADPPCRIADSATACAKAQVFMPRRVAAAAKPRKMPFSIENYLEPRSIAQFPSLPQVFVKTLSAAISSQPFQDSGNKLECQCHNLSARLVILEVKHLHRASASQLHLPHEK